MFAYQQTRIADFAVPGQQAYTTGGTYTWICPAGVNTIHVVAVGGGGAGYAYWSNACGAGGGLGWKNNIRVIPGQRYTVQVGQGGVRDGGNGGNSYFQDPTFVAGYGGGNASSGYNTSGPNANGYGGGYTGDGGGAGGNATNYAGGGGAGGYQGRGGNSQESWNASVIFGAYGGAYYSSAYGSGSGGGVGLLGATGYPSSGNAFYSAYIGYNNSNNNGSGGSGAHGGNRGLTGHNPSNGTGETSDNLVGGDYGGGGGGPGTSWPNASGEGGRGAVRIIWSGTTNTTRAFPATNTGNL